MFDDDVINKDLVTDIATDEIHCSKNEAVRNIITPSRTYTMLLLIDHLSYYNLNCTSVTITVIKPTVELFK